MKIAKVSFKFQMNEWIDLFDELLDETFKYKNGYETKLYINIKIYAEIVTY